MTDTAAPKPDLRAFELRASAGALSGATTSYGDGKTFDIVQALKDGDGTILVNAYTEPSLSEALMTSPLLKDGKVPERVPAADKIHGGVQLRPEDEAQAVAEEATVDAGQELVSAAGVSTTDGAPDEAAPDEPTAEPDGQADKSTTGRRSSRATS